MATNRRISALIVSAMIAFGASTHSGSGAAEEAVPVGSLEHGFWLCDYLATTRGLHAAPVSECSANIEELKHRKFGGDIVELLGWWREHRIVEHRKLEASHHGPGAAALR